MAGADRLDEIALERAAFDIFAKRAQFLFISGTTLSKFRLRFYK